MPDEPARMFARSFYYNSRAQRRLRVVALPLIRALIEPGGRYSTSDPRRAPSPAPPPILPHRRGSRGPSAASIAKLWAANDGDRAVFRQKLEARLHRENPSRADPDAETEQVARRR